MSDQPLVASVDTAVLPAPGYYPDPSVPGFVRYWNGGDWVPGTSRPAPAPGEVLQAPRFAARSVPRPNARYIPPPVVAPVEPAETGPVFLDQTAAGTRFTLGPESAWRADPLAQCGLLDTGTAPRRVSWGVEGEAPPVGPAAGAPVIAEPEPVSELDPAPEPGPESESEPESEPVAVAALLPVPVQAALPARTPAPRKSAEPTSASAPAPSRRRAAAPAPGRPAGLGRRLAARLLDSALLAAVTAVAVLPLAPAVTADVQDRLRQARAVSALTHRQVQVWLLDGLVLGHLAILLAVLLLAGFLLDVLPTARTGRTLGKRLAGLRVERSDDRRPPSLGRALLRWLVGQLAVLTVVGGLAVLLDRRRRRGWHDRAARTAVVRG